MSNVKVVNIEVQSTYLLILLGFKRKLFASHLSVIPSGVTIPPNEVTNPTRDSRGQGAESWE